MLFKSKKNNFESILLRFSTLLEKCWSLYNYLKCFNIFKKQLVLLQIFPRKFKNLPLLLKRLIKMRFESKNFSFLFEC